MCQIQARNSRTCFFRWRSTERKTYYVCAFCGRRAASRNRNLHCRAFDEPDRDWFNALERPATQTEYDARARQLGVQHGPAPLRIPPARKARPPAP